MAAKKTANDVVDSHLVTTTVTNTGLDLGSSDGIRRAIEALVKAVRGLADHIDGVADPAAPTPPSSKPLA
jgi:hypothetical protein